MYRHNIMVATPTTEARLLAGVQTLGGGSLPAVAALAGLSHHAAERAVEALAASGHVAVFRPVTEQGPQALYVRAVEGQA